MNFYFIYFLLQVEELSFCFQFLSFNCNWYFYHWWKIIKQNAVLFTEKSRYRRVMMNRWFIASGLKYSKRPFCSGKILESVKVCSSTQLKLRVYLNKREIMIFVIKFRRNFGRNFVIFVNILLAWHILLVLFFLKSPFHKRYYE